jgi:hypothetical protein
VRRKAGLLAAGVLAACSPLSPYQSTAAKLEQMELVRPSVTFIKEWQPVRRTVAESPADESARGRFWLDSCVSELSARFTPAPGSAARAAQIAECMQARGWHLVVRESNVAPPAEHDARGAAPQVVQ